MCLSTQIRLVRLTGLFCLLLSYYSVHSQLTLFGDLYIAPQNEMHIAAGDLYFKSGKIITDRGANSGTLSFAKGTTWERANHDTHVDGFIRFYDREVFTFPVGHDNVLQPALLSDFSGSDHFDMAYQHKGHSVTATANSVASISDTHFWELRNPAGRGRIILSWNVFSGIDRLLGTAGTPQDALDLITIGGFDGTLWQPIATEMSEISLNEGKENSLLSGYVQSKNTIDFSRFRAFTLMMRNLPDIDSEKISQAITPNGDGKNDTWIIQGIEQFPNVNISVFNRWGEAVFEAPNGYNNDWAGNHKNSREILPTGPYFYVIDQQNDGVIDLSGWLYISD